MVVAISSDAEVIAPLSTDRFTQARAIDALDPWSTTALHDAIIATLDRLEPEPGRQALVVFSDGTDRYSHATAAEVIERARRSNALIYPIAFGKQRPPLLAELAVLTGGRSFLLRDATELEKTLSTIARELRYQYLLGYAPADADRRGRARMAIDSGDAEGNSPRAARPRPGRIHDGLTRGIQQMHLFELRYCHYMSARARNGALRRRRPLRPAAARDLRKLGIPRERVSRSWRERMTRKGRWRRPAGIPGRRSRIRRRRRVSESWARIWLRLIAYVMPGIGPIVADGPLAAALGEAAGTRRRHSRRSSSRDSTPNEAARWEKRIEGGAFLVGAHVERRAGRDRSRRVAPSTAGRQSRSERGAIP